MVSLVFVTYNRASRVELSLCDILNQTFKDFELIICDDHSTDGTSDICRYFAEKDSRIIYIRQEKNIGMPGNVNVGIQMARYPYIGILHDGDRFEPHLVERWFNGINSAPQIGLVFCRLSEIGSSETPNSSDPHLAEGIHEGKHLLKNYYFTTYSFSSVIYGMAMFRQEYVKRSGGFDLKYGFYADVDFWMSILQESDAYYCNESLIRYPSKVEQPRIFDDRQVKTLLNLHNMFLKHRILYYKKRPLALIKEVATHYVYLLFRFLLIIRFLARNGDYRDFQYNTKPLLKESSFLILLTPFWFLFRLVFFLKTKQ